MSNVPATAMNGALLLPAATRTTTMMTTTMMTTARTTAARTTASADTLFPTARTGVTHHDATPTYPTTKAPGILQAPQQYPVYTFCRIPSVHHSSCRLTNIRSCPGTTPPPPMIVQAPVWVARKLRPQVESHCCKIYWKYHVQ
jgi:hypothetical protein